jgi:hypothetical protein
VISEHSLQIEHVQAVSKKNRIDPILTEKFIRALTLLELLQRSGLTFIFKGGTSLALLLADPKRLSIDIDIIVDIAQSVVLRTLLCTVLGKAGFYELSEDHRTSSSAIPKAHYKFHYQSCVEKRAAYVLVDILFETNPYVSTRRISIRSDFLQSDNAPTLVTVPTVDSILGDKMTAFAPNTTGIKYWNSKELEIIKQLFDISYLFDVMSQVSEVADSFHRIARREIGYRNLSISSDDVLRDILNTSLIIAFRGSISPGCYAELMSGINKMKAYTIGRSFSPDQAILCAAKAAYLSTLVMKGSVNVVRFSSEGNACGKLITHPRFTKFNKIRKTSLEAFHYLYEALEISGVETSFSSID